MRKLLLLALLLYNIITLATRVLSYDYEDLDVAKRHSILEDRRNWRKKSLLKEDWDNHERRHNFDSPSRYVDEQGMKLIGGVERQRDMEYPYGGMLRGLHYGDDKLISHGTKSVEYIDKEHEKKPVALSCEKLHERYEPCFAGCASVSCDNPRDRLRPCYPFCEAGCICVQPFVRDDRTHKCVLPEECTKGLKGIPDLGDET